MCTRYSTWGSRRAWGRRPAHLVVLVLLAAAAGACRDGKRAPGNSTSRPKPASAAPRPTPLEATDHSSARFLPPSTGPGWRLQGKIRHFNKQDLFKHINGAAGTYFTHGFQQCTTARYLQTSPHPKGSEASSPIQVDLYVMGDALGAFGVFTTERPEGTPAQEGPWTQGYRSGSLLAFVHGRYYVKVVSMSPGPGAHPVQRRLASLISRELGPPGSLPAQLKLFPEQHRVAASAVYYPQDFLGLSSLFRVFATQYNDGVGSFRLFFSRQKDPAAAETILRRLTSPRQGRRHTLLKEEDGVTEIHAIQEEFLGHVLLAAQGRHVAGAVSSEGPRDTSGPRAAATLRQLLSSLAAESRAAE